MISKTWFEPPSPLTETLPGATFGEWHHGVVDAEAADVWQALHRLRWTDIAPPARVALHARGFGVARLLDRPWLDTFADKSVVVEDAPHTLAFVTIGQPWSPVPRSMQVANLDQVSSFAQPGWLKYGMDWTLTPLPDGRTLVETRTLCEATDGRARRRFSAYWLVIRAASGLIRQSMITAIARSLRSEAAEGSWPRGGAA